MILKRILFVVVLQRELIDLDLDELRRDNIELKTYQDIIRQAERVYSDKVKSNSWRLRS